MTGVVEDAGRIEALHRTEPCLDGLRAVAVFSVVFSHFGVPGFGGGAYGVDIFFVLSGYLITRVLYTGERKGRGLPHFYWHRLVRLLPVLLIVSFSIFLIPRSYLPRPQAWNDVVASLTYVSNWTRAYPTGTPMYLGHSWSLSIEEQFYLLWPLIFLSMIRRSYAVSRFGSLLLLSFALSWLLWTYFHYDFERVYNGFDTHCAGLLLGCCLAQFGKLRLPTWVAALAASAYALIVIFTFWSPPTALVAWAASAIIIDHAVSDSDTYIKRVLAWKPAVFIGLISYSLYLWHYPIFLLGYQMKASWLLRTLLGVSASIALASTTYLLVERPCRLARDKIPSHIIAALGRASAAYAATAFVIGIAFFWYVDIANAIYPTPLKIVDYGPREFKHGEGFNVQPDGTSALWIKLSRSAPDNTRIVLGDNEPKTVLQGVSITGLFRSQNEIGTGKLRLRLINKSGESLVEPVTVTVR